MPTEEARIAEIEEKAQGAGEHRSFPWQNRMISFPIIIISLEDLLLNPNSHRIRSQRESHQEAELLTQDPFGDRAQEIVATFLRETPGFEPLKDNLKEIGQTDPGIITNKGVLINGNTRAVALRELDERYITVAVLPGDAVEKEIDELEARLQLARDFKQEYTPTNELLFIQEQIENGVSKEDLAILLGKAQSRNRAHLNKGVNSIEKSIRILQCIREIQDMSGGTIPLSFFDPHESALTEADNAFIALRDDDPAQARRVRDGRMTGMLVGTTYRNLRKWDGDGFLNEYIEEQFQESDALILASAADSADPPSRAEDLDVDWLEDREEDEGPSGNDSYDPGRFLQLAAGSFVKPNESEIIPGVTKETLFNELESVITTASMDKDLDERGERRRTSPIRLLKTARSAIAKARATLDRAKTEPGFQVGAMKQELRKTRKELEQLDRTLGAD